MKRPISTAGVLLAGGLISIPALLGADFAIDWSKVAGGGGTSTNAQYVVSGTLGQPDAGPAMIGGAYSITGGFWSILSVVQTPGAPRLDIAHVGNQVVVSWASSATNWTLQTNNNINGGAWGSYTGPAGNNSVTNSITAGRVFYRLWQP